MDGSVVTVVILGQDGVGKTSFIKRIETFAVGLMRNPCVLDICGHHVRIKFVDSPDRSTLIPTTTIVIILFDLTNEASFTSLAESLEIAQRVSPVALRAVVGTKSDLTDERKISPEQALEFCREHSEGSQPMPYYETSLEPMDCVFIAFQEIVARPLINDYTLKSDTEQEQIRFAHEIMDWALQNNSANILTHLRTLGYVVPVDLIERDPEMFREYLLTEYPLQIFPHFTTLELEETAALQQNLEDSELEDYEKEPLAVHDTRPTIEVTPTHHLLWQDISLTLFTVDLLPEKAQLLTHVNVSNNKLTSIPLQLFQLPHLETLNISHNLLTQLPCLEHWNTDSRLQVLYASHNFITCNGYSPLLYRKSDRRTRQPFRELWCVDLSCNRLNSFPMFILHFPLKLLNISHNPKVTQLPVELGQLALSVLQVEGLPLTDPPPFVVSGGTQAIIHYLKLRRSSSAPWSSIRVAVVGEEGAGKSTLINRLCNDSPSNITATKGLQVVEWKYRGNDILSSFRNRWFTFDLWDFSGNIDYRCIYNCFNCSSSVHLVIASAIKPHDELMRWLSDIQAMCRYRVPVVIVFTHMDCLKSKEARDEFKRQRLRWIEIQNRRGDTNEGTVTLQVTMSQSVHSLPGDKTLSGFQAPQEAFDMEKFAGEDIPLMPMVIRTHFVNNVTGEGVVNVRKTLYKIATGSFTPTSQVMHPVLKLVGQDVPTAYVNLEMLVRQLRTSIHQSRKEGGQRAFYTVEQLGDKLRRQMKEARIRESDLIPGLEFLHHLGFVLIYRCSNQSSLLVSVDPQMIGYLFQRMIKAGLVAKETDPSSSHLPNTHLFMLWGVDPVWSYERGPAHSVSTEQLLDFLYSTNIFSPLLSGVTLLPSLLPPTLPRSCDPDSESLISRRAYFFSYLPTLFPAQLIARVVSKLQSLNPRSLSPGQTIPAVTLPILTTSGYRVHMWCRNLFIEDTQDGSKVWMYVREGKAVGPDVSPHCGRVDILLDAPLEREAIWLKLITKEIDELIPEEYPTLLDPPHHVEIFIPLRPEHLQDYSSHDNTDTNGQQDSLSGPPLQISGSFPTESPSHSQMSDHSEWEVLSKQSTTSTRLSVKVDLSTPNTQLLPLWECLQEAFKAPVIQINSGRLNLQKALPDLLFADLPPEQLLRTTVSSPEQYLFSLEDHFSGGESLSDKETGLHTRSYYTSEQADICIGKPAGALKTFHLQSLLYRIRGDLETLQDLRSPFLVAPVGISYCPPSLALECAPYGSLSSLLQKRGRANIGRDVIHYISLQMLHALEFFHNRDIPYHGINSDNVLIWSLDPVQIKLSDTGVTHSHSGCDLCRYLDSIPNPTLRQKTSRRCDYVLVGLLVYQMATGKRPYNNIHSLEMVVIATLSGKVSLSVEAEHFLQNQQVEGNQVFATGCQRLCLQSTMDECVNISQPLNPATLQARFSVCAGDHEWSPMRLHVNVEAMICSEEANLVYWASGSRGLVTGTIEPTSGELLSNILQEAPPPASGLFANRRAKPVPIAVGRATAAALVSRTQQFWVGTENGQRGSVYVFNLPDMRRHHHIHLQDAVLSICAVNDKAEKLGEDEQMAYRVLVGLANGTVILFMGVSGDKVLENPLQGPKQIVSTSSRKPCLTLELTRDGYIWCSVGDSLEVLDMKTLKSVQRLNCQVSPDSGGRRRSSNRGDVIILMCVNSLGVWTVSRRSHVLRLWSQVNGALLASYSVQNILAHDEPDITALTLHGGAVWLGTRNGYIFILDASKMSSGHDNPLLGIQFCGVGRVKGILPLKPWKKVTTKLEVLCSLELPDEVSGMLMSWEYLPHRSTCPTYPIVAASRTHSTPKGVSLVIDATPPSLSTHLELYNSV